MSLSYLALASSWVLYFEALSDWPSRKKQWNDHDWTDESKKKFKKNRKENRLNDLLCGMNAKKAEVIQRSIALGFVFLYFFKILNICYWWMKKGKNLSNWRFDYLRGRILYGFDSPLLLCLYNLFLSALNIKRN